MQPTTPPPAILRTTAQNAYNATPPTPTPKGNDPIASVLEIDIVQSAAGPRCAASPTRALQQPATCNPDHLAPADLSRVVWPEPMVTRLIVRGLAPGLKMARSIYPKADYSPTNIERQARRAMEETRFLPAFYKVFADNLNAETLKALARMRQTPLGQLVFDRYEVLCGQEGANAVLDPPRHVGPQPPEKVRSATELRELTDSGMLSDEKRAGIAQIVAFSFTDFELKELKQFFSETGEGCAYAEFTRHCAAPFMRVMLNTNVITRANDFILEGK